METKAFGDITQFRKISEIENIIPNQRRNEQIQPAENENKVSFGDFLMGQLQEVNRLTIDADHQIRDKLSGVAQNPHSALIAMQKADISFRLLMSVKERIVQAYQQLIRTPI